MKDQLPKLLRVSTFADVSGISRKAVKSMILQKRLKAQKLDPSKRNSPYLIPSEELYRFLDEAAA